MLNLPANFVATAEELHGEAGRAWIVRLPAIVAACERRWGLVAGPHFPNLSYNYVAPATGPQGEPLVLKIGLPEDDAFVLEAAALRHYDGRGAVRLRAVDDADRVLLLERLVPGTMLSAVADDERATLIAASVMRRLWHPPAPGHPFPHVDRWIAGLGRLRARFDGGTGPFPAALVDRAERLFADLSAGAAAPVVLHGDLHHYNILDAGGGTWAAIDPKGIIGEPAYEIGAFLRNPNQTLLAMPHPGRLLARRIDLLAAELDLDRARIRDWALAQAVLSAWWSVEDHGHGWEFAIAVAELLAGIAL